MSGARSSFCIGCGCDDTHPCVDGLDEPCGWLRVDPGAGVGVCSSCPDDVRRWDAGERDPNRDGPEA